MLGSGRRWSFGIGIDVEDGMAGFFEEHGGHAGITSETAFKIFADKVRQNLAYF